MIESNSFSALSTQCDPVELVKILNDLFARFDKLSNEESSLRIKLLGYCYYCVAGLPAARLDHADRCVRLGLQMIKAINTGKEIYPLRELKKLVILKVH